MQNIFFTLSMDTVRNSASFSNIYDRLMRTQTASDANHVRKKTTCDRVDSSDGSLVLSLIQVLAASEYSLLPCGFCCYILSSRSVCMMSGCAPSL